MNVSEHIAAWLERHGIRHAFGIIGGGNVALWDAIARHEKTELVTNHHEQAAAMAASYYARSTGNIGVALVTTGAGSANALTGVLAAYMDGTPLLVISGNEASQHMHADTRVWGVQGYASSETAAKITKGARRCMDAGRVIHTLEWARDFALAAPQGPVWIDIPKDLQNASV